MPSALWRVVVARPLPYGCRAPGAGGANQLLDVSSACLAAGEKLRRECLVDIEEVDLAQAETRLGEGRLVE
eukprot:scaffold11802_cov36-Phaeocystis_antarctica.AAC.1